MNRLLHRHIWKWKERGTGVYEKGKQNIRVVAEGVLARCECGKTMFFPDSPHLFPVEAERVNLKTTFSQPTDIKYTSE